MKPMEDEIDKIMNVASRIAPVPPSDALMQRLRQIPSNVRETYDSIPKKYVWLAAASIALLIALNIASARTYNASEEGTSNASSYFSHLNSL